MCYSQRVCEEGFFIIRKTLEAQHSLCELEQLQPQKNHMRIEVVIENVCWSKAWESVSLKLQQCILHPPEAHLCCVMKHLEIFGTIVSASYGHFVVTELSLHLHKSRLKHEKQHVMMSRQTYDVWSTKVLSFSSKTLKFNLNSLRF